MEDNLADVLAQFGGRLIENEEELIEHPQEEQAEEVVEEEGQQQQEEVVTEEPQEEQPQETSSFKYETKQQEQQDAVSFSDEDILSAISERLGRTVSSFEELTQQQSIEDEELETIARFKKETGRSLNDFMFYQSLDTAQMDDLTAVRLKYQLEYPELSAEERDILIDEQFKVDEEIYSESELRVGRTKLKAEATRAKKDIESLRSQYLLKPATQKEPEVVQEQSLFDDKWLNDVDTTLKNFEGIEFAIENDKTFTFKIDENYKSSLKSKNKGIESYFEQYQGADGSWNHDLFNAHLAVIDNIENIVQMVYKQGKSDGQKSLVADVANAKPTQPVSASTKGGNYAELIKEAIGSSNRKLTINI